MASDLHIRRDASWPAATTSDAADDGVDPDLIRRARRAVAGAQATRDANDCRQLLDMLGLLNPAELTEEIKR